MLKSVIQYVQLRPEPSLCLHSGLVPVFPHHNWNLKPSRHQQGLVPKLCCRSRGINHRYAFALPAVAAREDVEFHAPGLEHTAQQQHRRGFSRTTHREISNAHDGPGQVLRA